MISFQRGKYRARVKHDGRDIDLGYFDTEGEARQVVTDEYNAIRNGTSHFLNPDLIGYQEFARKLGIPYGTVKRWVHEGMPCVRSGSSVRLMSSVAEQWVKENRGDSVSFGRVAVVYVAQRDSDRAVKIGWTSNLFQRQRELRKVSGNVAVFAAIPGDKPVELRLHERFKAFRIDGEWFAVPLNDVMVALKEEMVAA